MSEAQHKAQGIVGISLMLQIGDTPNPELRIITSAFNKVLYKGSSTPIRHISLRSLLPNTEQYMTYEGSTTHPGCWESTVWIILNKPIYITKQEVSDERPKRCQTGCVPTTYSGYHYYRRTVSDEVKAQTVLLQFNDLPTWRL
uniref:Alpha-carbonic anhydrase domain-containing protein n=1 Tax=Anopheles maculatus TaxID=74869 RepID=A0A182TCS6_9DIPT